MPNNMSVLIVDDSSIIREKLHRLMEEIKRINCIYQATDYDSAVTEIHANKPSIVLLDINLPGKNGIELLREIKNINKEIKVIMVSNMATEYHRKVCGFLGADFFLDKHHDFEHLPCILNKLHTNMN